MYDVDQALPRYIVHFGVYGLDVANTHMHAAGDGLVRHNLHPQRVFDPDNQLQMHFRLAEAQFLRTLHNGSGNLKLIKVEYVVNPKLIKSFEAQQAEFEKKGESTDIVLAFHGTRTREAVDRIVQHNFDPQRIGSATDAGCYGKGFYFSEFASTSMGYGGSGNMLLCRLLPGKTFDALGRMDGQRIKQGFHSHRVAKNADGCGNEIVIDNPDQILPCYILHVGQLGGAMPS